MVHVKQRKHRSVRRAFNEGIQAARIAGNKAVAERKRVAKKREENLKNFDSVMPKLISFISDEDEKAQFTQVINSGQAISYSIFFDGISPDIPSVVSDNGNLYQGMDNDDKG